MELHVDHIWPIIPAVSIRPYKGRFFDRHHHLAQKDTPLPLDVHARVHAQWICAPDIIISYPTSASGIIVLLKTPTKY